MEQTQQSRPGRPQPRNAATKGPAARRQGAGQVDANSSTARRDRIARAGIRIIAYRGMRAMTHRAVDAEAGLPLGSSSYYAPTRQTLIAEIVRVLAEHCIADLENASHTLSDFAGRPARITREKLLGVLVDAVDSLFQRPEELRVRCALLLELGNDDPSRAALAEQSPVQHQMTQGLTDALSACGIAAPQERAVELMNLCDALLMRAAVSGAPMPVAPILAAYLDGLDQA